MKDGIGRSVGDCTRANDDVIDRIAAAVEEVQGAHSHIGRLSQLPEIRIPGILASRNP